MSLFDTPDYWGRLEEAPVGIEDGTVRVVLSPLSCSKAVLPAVQKFPNSNAVPDAFVAG